MEIINPKDLTENEKSELIQKVRPYIKGITFKDDIQVPIGNRTVTCAYNASGDSLSIQEITEAKAADKNDQQTSNEVKLQTLLDKGEVTLNRNWYTYKGSKYLGKAKILAAIS